MTEYRKTQAISLIGLSKAAIGTDKWVFLINLSINILIKSSFPSRSEWQWYYIRYLRNISWNKLCKYFR